MAVLREPAPSLAGSLFELQGETPPKGTFVASCIDTKDAYGVERKKYQSEQMERVDLTGFLFGLRDKAGKPYKIATRSMRLSGSPKSALYQFLTSWLGEPPAYNMDLSTLKGRKALLTIAHEPSRTRPGVAYARIIGVAPVPEGFETSAGAPPVKPPEPTPFDSPQDELPF